MQPVPIARVSAIAKCKEVADEIDTGYKKAAQLDSQALKEAFASSVTPPVAQDVESPSPMRDRSIVDHSHVQHALSDAHGDRRCSHQLLCIVTKHSMINPHRNENEMRKQKQSSVET